MLVRAYRALPKQRRASESLFGSRFFSSDSKQMAGHVKFWNEERGYGFVIPADGGRDVYIHRSKLVDGFTPNAGDGVSLDLSWCERRKNYEATCVSLGNDKFDSDQKDLTKEGADANITLPTPVDALGRTSGSIRSDSSQLDVPEVASLRKPHGASMDQNLDQLTEQLEQLRLQGAQDQRFLLQEVYSMMQQQIVASARIERALFAIGERLNNQHQGNRDAASSQLSLATRNDEPNRQGKNYEGDLSQTNTFTASADSASASSVMEMRREEATDSRTHISSSETSHAWSARRFHLVGSFSRWTINSNAMGPKGGRIVLRNSAPRIDERGTRQEEFQIVGDGAWEKCVYPACGEEEVVLLHPGKPSKALRGDNSIRHGSGRKWAVQGPARAAFKVLFDGETDTLVCELES